MIEGITKREKTSEGGLDYWGWDCPECKMEIRSSLQSLIEGNVWAHIDYHIAKEVTRSRQQGLL